MSVPRFLDAILTAVFFLLGVLAIVGVRRFPFDDQLFPVTAALLMISCSVIYGIRQVINPSEPEDDTGPGAPPPPFAHAQTKGVLLQIAAILVLVLGVFVVGHLIAVPTFVFGYIIWKKEPAWIAALGASTMLLFIWLLLIEVMHVAMPRPLLGNWLPF